MSVFRCTECNFPLRILQQCEQIVCSQCSRSYGRVGSTPALFKDQELIRSFLEEAKKDGRLAWYEDHQTVQLTGPYRHHMAKRRAYLDDALKRFVKISDSHRALDLGTGDGLNLGWLAKHFQQVFASDYNPTRIARAQKVAPSAITFLADIRNYPVQDSSFDFILFNHVLEHIPEDRLALQEYFRILKPGGIGILGVPNEGAFFWQLAYRLQPKTRKESDHVHFYTLKSIREKCLQTGFEILETVGIGWGIPHWGIDARVRGFKWMDDIFDGIGRRLLPSQASSLYLILSKPKSSATLDSILQTNRSFEQTATN